MIDVIGAGLPRTATTTLMVALEQLGYGPCYHMRDLLADLPSGLPLWEAVADGRPDWDAIFKDARSTLDWPSARYWRELADHYPQAKIVLSVRPVEAWERSMRDTVWAMYFGGSVLHHLCQGRGQVDEDWAGYLRLMTRMTWEPGAALAEAGGEDPDFAAAMTRWNDEVQASLPPERLLVWDPKDGWEPLCRFLGVDAPAGELPRINDTHGFKEGIIGGALEVLNAWWDRRERPTSGLHGASLGEEAR